MGGKNRGNDERTAEGDEVAFRRNLDKVLALGLSEKHGPRIRSGVVLLLQPGGPNRKKEDFAEIRRVEMEQFFHKKGLTSIVVPILPLSNRQIRDGRKAGLEYFFRPATKLLMFSQFMAAVGQPTHWTVTHDDRHKIGWEDASLGYWFTAEVGPSCPRLKTSWNDLNKKIRLLALEEYVIVWHERKTKGIVLDIPTWCWLRTRWNVSGALNADEVDGEVLVYWFGAEHLSRAFDVVGGRVAEVVRIAP